MRTLGPRSVASFLKILLFIAYVFIGFLLVAFGAIALLSAIGMATGMDLPDWRWWGPVESRRIPIFAVSPRGATILISICLNLTGALIILGRLIKIFRTLTTDTPFVFENARRLRVIGLVMAALQISEFVVWALLVRGTPLERSPLLRPDIDFVGLFGIGVMFVLAEVFDEGARMRKDLDLTI